MCAKRTKSQKTGSVGHKIALLTIEQNPDWIARSQDEDYGIDAEGELVGEEVQGEIIKFQFKSSEKVVRSSSNIKLQIERKYLVYAETCRIPVIFVVIDITTHESWYLWLQDWLIQGGKVILNQNPGQNDFTIWIDEEKTLKDGLNDELIDIAKWRGETQLLLSLLDTLKAATATYNELVVDSLIDYIGSSGEVLANHAIEIIVEEAICLGDRLRATRQGHLITDSLFRLVRIFGDRMGIDIIDRMVSRDVEFNGESFTTYSRAGIDALGIMYDEFFTSAKGMNLPNHFLKKELPRVAYYCAMREEFPEMKDISFGNRSRGFKYAGLKYSFPENHSFLNKYANRGASAILDYLVMEDKD